MRNYSELTLYEIMEQGHGCERASPCGISIHKLGSETELGPTDLVLFFEPSKTKWVLRGLKVDISHVSLCKHVFQWYKPTRVLITSQDQLK
jgi:hypothetical protein